MQGWALWSPSGTGSTTRTYEGDFNTGNQSFNLTRHTGGTTCQQGANLVGNPYPSSLNWESSDWTLTNVSPTIYLWNSTSGNTGTYNRDTDVSTNGVDSIIPPKQGFFVKVTSGNTSGTISVGNDARIHCQNRPVYKRGKVVLGTCALITPSAMFFHICMIGVEKLQVPLGYGRPLHDCPKMSVFSYGSALGA